MAHHEDILAYGIDDFIILAQAVAEIVPNVQISINKDAQPDKRSYRVDFSRFKELAPNHQPVFDLPTTIEDLKKGLETMKFHDPDFRSSDSCG